MAEISEPTPPGEPERLETALDTVRELFGVDYPVEPQAGEPENMLDLNRLMLEHAFTDSWARPGLDRRTKSFLTMAFVIAMGGQSRELRNHIGGALMLGITQEEIIEVLIHANAYCGAPRTSDALIQAHKVFARVNGTT